MIGRPGSFNFINALKWLWTALYFLTSAILAVAMAGIAVQILFAVAIRIPAAFRYIHAWLADLAVLAQIAIGVGLVILVLPIVVVAIMAAPVVLRRVFQSVVFAIALHFEPLWRVLAAPFRSRKAPD